MNATQFWDIVVKFPNSLCVFKSCYLLHVDAKTLRFYSCGEYYTISQQCVVIRVKKGTYTSGELLNFFLETYESYYVGISGCERTE